jgi:Ca-activated chloride channel family protein
VVEQIREGLASSREEGEKARKPLERFLWPLSAAFILFVLSHLIPLFWLKPLPSRRAAAQPRRALAVLAGFLAVPATLDAADPLQPGLEAYARQDYAGALSAYEGILGESLPARAQNRVQMGLGAAAYRLGNFERAAEAYGAVLANGEERLRGEAHYNLGNTLYRRGEAALLPAPDSPRDPDQPQAASGSADAMERAKADWNGAVEHFESALALDPDNAKTRHNLEYVKQRLEELKQQEEQQQQQQQQQQNKDQKQDPPESEKDQQKKEEQKPEDKKDQPQEGKQDPNEDQPKDSQDPREGNEPKDQNDSESPGSKKPESDPKEGNPDKPPKDEPGESGKPEDEGKPGAEQEPGNQPPREPEQPKDGKLEANPNQSQQDPGQEGRAGQTGGSEARPNPLTGYSPTEARQLLDALADETEVRPVLQPARGEKFKNW